MSDVEFDQVRPRLFGIAYRMLGSVADAEDVVQDAWLRWHRTDQSTVQNPTAFLSTTTTRLAINAATSARSRREVYVGPWLPEPVDTSNDPALGAEQAEALDLAVLLLLERLAPRERAAYILREAFEYPFREIAEILGTSELNARQLARRARTHLESERHAPVDSGEHRRLLAAFTAAAQSGDLAELTNLLADTAVSYSDGGGIVSAARIPVRGRDRVARFVVGIVEKYGQGTTSRMIDVNGGPSLLVCREGTPMVLVTLDATADGIERLLMVLNPDKLAGLTDKERSRPQ